MFSHRFLKLHPHAVNPPDIQSYKAFLEFYSKNTPGRLGDRPTVGTVEDFRRDFEAGMSRCQNYRFPDQVSTTIREVRLKIPITPNDFILKSLSSGFYQC